MSTDSFVDTTVAPGGQYSYALDARDAQGASAQGTPASISIPSLGSKTFDVMNYGADPTGKTPSTTAFINAKAAAQKVGAGGTVYAPDGDYLIDASAGTSSCIQVQASGIGIMGDGTGIGGGKRTRLILAKVGLNPGTQRRPGLIGVPNGFDGIAIDGLYLDSRTNNGPTYPAISKDPDPQILNVSSSHNRVSNIAGMSGTGFCVRFTGPNPCEGFTVGDNIVENMNLDTLSYGGGFIALDCDCQGLGGAVTIMRQLTLIGSMAIFYASHVQVSEFTFTPTKYQMPCAPCVEITSSPSGPSHDISITDPFVSNGGAVKLLGALVANLVLPSGMYWKAGC